MYSIRVPQRKPRSKLQFPKTLFKDMQYGLEVQFWDLKIISLRFVRAERIMLSMDHRFADTMLFFRADAIK
jgi:hypothetical protein